MKPLNLFRIQLTSKRLLSFFSLASLMFSMALFSQIGQAQQQTQLSLADILIGLRSKKVTLNERNKLLSEAVKVRGITFALTSEIETELTTTGASGELLEAVRAKADSNPAMISVSLTTPVAGSTAAPDAVFYRNRANENNLRGELELALADYARAIEMNPNDVASYFNRARVYANQKSFDLAILDFDKVLELNPKDAMAYVNRAAIYEKKGNSAQATADYQKAFELDANNQNAKTNLKRLQDEQATALLKQKEAEQAKLSAKLPASANSFAPPTENVKPETPAPIAPSNAPQSIELGQLNSVALKLAMPIYPEMARRLNAQGKVVVQIALDEEGKVVSAKATTGNSLLRGVSEDAARRSKFKPATASGQAIKATGFVIYNFVDAP